DVRYRALRPLAIAAPLMVFAQALLGGLTVLLRLPRAITLSHLTLSMCFFSVLIVLAIRIGQTDRQARSLAVAVPKHLETSQTRSLAVAVPKHLETSQTRSVAVAVPKHLETSQTRS